MTPHLLKAGYFWRSDDAANIIVGESSISDMVCASPRFVSVLRMDRTGTIRDQEIRLSLAPLHFIQAGVFGSTRPMANGLVWTGNGRRYGVYEYTSAMGLTHIVILAQSPEGTTGIMLPNESTATWQAVFYGMKPESVWDVCNNLATRRPQSASERMEGAHHAKAKNEKNDLRHDLNPNPPASMEDISRMHPQEAVHIGG